MLKAKCSQRNKKMIMKTKGDGIDFFGAEKKLFFLEANI